MQVEFAYLITPYLTIEDAATMRQVNHAWKDLVKRLPWNDTRNVAQPDFVARHLPSSIGARFRHSSVQEDENRTWTAVFRITTCLKHLNLHQCVFRDPPCFAPLSGLKSLNLSDITSPWVTDDVFMQLNCLEELDMGSLNCENVTSVGMGALSSLRKLAVRSCYLGALAEPLLLACSGLVHLDAAWCQSLTNANFVHLGALRVLNLSGCTQPTLTDAAFQHLTSLESLNMQLCGEGLTSHAFVPLGGRLKDLNIDSCLRKVACDATLQLLSGLTALNIARCNHTTITDAGLQSLRHLLSLSIDFCSQSTITDSGLGSLRHLTALSMQRCTIPTITDAAFE